jgi:hypothetical protein
MWILPLSLLPLPPPPLCLSPSVLSILLTTYPPLFLSIHFLTTSLPPSSPSSSSLPEGEEGGREVVRRRIERNEDKEGGREAMRSRMERKGEKGSEEDDYFNKFPPTMPSVYMSITWQIQ